MNAAAADAERVPSRGARRWQPADTVVAVATALLVTVFAVFGFLIWQGYNATLASAEERAQRGAAIVASQAQWLIRSSLLFLDQANILLDSEPSNLTSPLREELDRTLGNLPPGTEIALYDANGSVVANGGFSTAPASLAGTPLFSELQAGARWAISRQMAPGPGDVASFAIGRRFERDGVFTGAMALSMSGLLMRDFWSLHGLGEESTVSLVRTDGWVIARYPPLPEAIDVSAQPPFQEFAEEESGTYGNSVSPADGIARVVAFRRVPEMGIVAIASVSQDAVTAGLWSAVRTVMFLLAPIAAALLAGSFLTARLLRQSERSRQKLEDALEHNETLFREIHHRVKNNLQSVVSLLQLQPIPREVKVEMGQRIAAMSAVHEHIYRTSSFATVSIRDYLRTLIHTIAEGHDPGLVTLSENIENLSVDKDTALPLGLILNEVVANAYKHAFPEGQGGSVVVTVESAGGDNGRLIVEDNGAGYDTAAQTKGIGRRLIGALTAQIRGRSEATSSAKGSRFELTFPLAGSPRGGAAD